VQDGIAHELAREQLDDRHQLGRELLVACALRHPVASHGHSRPLGLEAELHGDSVGSDRCLPRHVG